MAIKYMRKLVMPMIQAMAKEREIVKELTSLESRLRFLDKTPDEELTAESAADIRRKCINILKILYQKKKKNLKN